MAPKYKLSYFDVKALAEPIRLIFAYAGVEYEDVRVPREDWPTMKPQTPWGVMPILEEDGKQLSMSMTIVRYLGQKYGLGPSDEFLIAKCNEYMDVINDVRLEAMKCFKEEDATKKEALKKILQDETLPRTFEKFTAILKKNGTGFLVGDKVTYADIYVSFFIEYLSGHLEATDKLQVCDALLMHIAKVNNLPGIREWIAKRPVTAF